MNVVGIPHICVCIGGQRDIAFLGGPSGAGLSLLIERQHFAYGGDWRSVRISMGNMLAGHNSY